MNNQPTPSPSILDEESRSFLLESCKWAKLFSAFGLILSTMMFFSGLIISLAGSTFTASLGLSTAGPVLGIIYLVMGSLNVYPSWKLLNYSRNMPGALHNMDHTMVAQSFRNMKDYFKFWGIMTVVIIVLYVIGMVSNVVSLLKG